MKNIHSLLICLFMLMASPLAFAESNYDIVQLYEVTKPASGTKAVNVGGYNKIDVEYILSPTKVNTGKYVVEVKKIGDNLYKILDTDICIETRYCNEWASFSEKVVLIIESNYGYTKGKVIFD